MYNIIYTLKRFFKRVKLEEEVQWQRRADLGQPLRGGLAITHNLEVSHYQYPGSLDVAPDVPLYSSTVPCGPFVYTKHVSMERGVVRLKGS